MTPVKAANGHATHAAPAPEPRHDPAVLDRIIEATTAQRFTLDEVRYIAENVAKSEMYGLSAAQAFVLLELAEAEGLHPIQAVRRYHVIEGKPSMRADAMQAEFQRRGGRVQWVESDAAACEALFSHAAYHPKPFRVRITLRELIDSEVAMQWPRARKGEAVDYSKGKVLKDTYRRFPRAMLRARVISEGVRAIDPGVVVGIYTPEEVTDFDDHPRPAPPTPAPEPRPQPRPQFPPRPQPPPDEPDPVPEPDDLLAWLQDQIDRTENDWKMTCAISKIDHKPLGEKGRSLTTWQVCNGIVKGWINHEPPLYTLGLVQTDGKWDQRKAFAAILHEWEDGTPGRTDLMADVAAYLRAKVEAAAAAAGINLDAEPEPTGEVVSG